MCKARHFVILTVTAILVLHGSASAQVPGQPFASYWFPTELLSWTPGGDADSPYNRGAIELATRTLGDTQANIHARPGEGRIAALSIMYPSTSGNPSQGAAVFDVYAFNYWQYTDRLVLWGGSAGEGLILAPSSDVIDAGHRNGVPVYGTVFFPPTAYGGQIQWVHDFVQNNGGVYPVADKLIEVAEYYGFDGWFINQETAGGTAALAENMRNMMEYIQLNSDISIMWYDAMVETGGISWQNALNANNDMFFEDGGTISNEMFLNFWWSTAGLASSAALATSLGRSPYDLCSGVDVQSNGYNTAVNWSGIFPEGNPHVTSLGFYCPNWCYSNSSSHPDFYTKANRFWVGANRDPSNTETSHPWKGMAHYVPANSPFTEVPFITNFNTGQGHHFSVNGSVMAYSDWNNRSLQDVLPTWRWITDCSGTALYPELDWTDAYWGGSCLTVSGDLYPGTPTTLYLYKTEAALSSGDNLIVAYSTGSSGTPSNMEIGLAFEDPEIFDYLAVGSSTTEGWNTVTIDLSAYSGRQLSVIALRFDASSAASGYEMKVGQLGIISGTQDTPAPPTNLYVESFQQIDDDRGTVRLRWNHSSDMAYMYNVYRINADDSRTWLWSTPNNACFVPMLNREAPETATTIEVVTIGEEFGVSSPDTTSVSWTVTGIEGSSSGISFGICDGYANPIRSNAAISYAISSAGSVVFSLYSLDGRLVSRLVDEPMPSGNHSAMLDTETLTPGVYFLRLESCGSVDAGKCIVIR